MTPAVRAFVTQLLARLSSLEVRLEASERRVAELEKENRELRQRLGMNSSNSSMPPSSDRPEQTPPKVEKPSTGKKRGGQAGHVKRERELIPTERCDKVENHVPRSCDSCGGRLAGSDQNPRRHQVTEIPQIKPTTTEHRIHTLTCSCCGKNTTAKLPVGVPSGRFGPNVVATVTMLTGLGRISQRIMAALLRDLFGLTISDGQISRLQTIGRKSLQAGYEEIVADVRKSATVNLDETGWVQNKDRAWMWVAVGPRASLYSIHQSRSRSVVHATMGDDYRGVVTSDRYSAYSDITDDRHQFCWAHLIRDFRAMVDRGGASEPIGARLLQSGREMIHHWNRCKRNVTKRQTFDKHLRRLKGEILDGLLDGSLCSDPKTAETCRRLGNACASLFVFAEHDGVSPTNNIAEQTIRKAVIFRKLSFNIEEQTGSRNLSVIFSTVETCRRQGLAAFDYIRAAVQTLFAGKTAPRLLPAG